MSGLPQGSASGSPKDCLRTGARDRLGVLDMEGGRCCVAGGVGGGACSAGGVGCRVSCFVDVGSFTEGVGRSGVTSMLLQALAYSHKLLTSLPLIDAVKREVFSFLRESNQRKDDVELVPVQTGTVLTGR